MAVVTKKKSKIDDNLTELRKILSVDLLMQEINQEEALEFLDAVESNYQDMKEALADAEKEVQDLDKEVEKLKSENDDLTEKVDELEERPEMYESIKTIDCIHYSTSNMQDQDVMEALAQAYKKLTPYQIVERLKV